MCHIPSSHGFVLKFDGYSAWKETFWASDLSGFVADDPSSLNISKSFSYFEIRILSIKLSLKSNQPSLQGDSTAFKRYSLKLVLNVNVSTNHFRAPEEIWAFYLIREWNCLHSCTCTLLPSPSAEWTLSSQSNSNKAIQPTLYLEISTIYIKNSWNFNIVVMETLFFFLIRFKCVIKT